MPSVYRGIDYNVMPGFDYDFFVIGAGSGGVRAARIAAGLGARTAIAEARFMGGTCVNVGCIPKKLYAYAAHFAADFEEGAAFGWQKFKKPDFDWSSLKSNKDNEIKRLNGIYENLLKNAGVTLFRGFATFEAANTIRIGEQTLTAEHILIATGGQPWMPDIPGIEHAINSDDFFELTEQPRSVAIVGGGFIATELAGIFKGLGSHVHLIHRGEQLLSGFDQDIRSFYTNCAKRDFDLHLNSEVTKISKTSDGACRVSLSDGNEIEVEKVLFATGRRPATSGLGLERVGVSTEKNGSIIVDSVFESSAKGVYAVGDVINRVNLTPVALGQGQVLARRLFGSSVTDYAWDNIPSAVFSDPQIATVGLTEAQARAEYPEIDIYRSQFRPLKYTLSRKEKYSMMKLIVDRKSDRVLGLHMVGDDAAEIVQGMAVAIKCGATKADFDATVGIHPTAAEEFVTMREPVADKQ